MTLSLISFLFVTTAAFNNDPHNHAYKRFSIFPPGIHQYNKQFPTQYHKNTKDVCEELYKRTQEETEKLKNFDNPKTQQNLRTIMDLFEEFNCYDNENIPAEHRKFMERMNKKLQK